MGRDPESGYHIVATLTTVVKARSIRRYTHNERFDTELVQGLTSAPWNLKGDGTFGPTCITSWDTNQVCLRQISTMTIYKCLYEHWMSLHSQKGQYNLHQDYHVHNGNVHRDSRTYLHRLHHQNEHKRRIYKVQNVRDYTELQYATLHAIVKPYR